MHSSSMQNVSITVTCPPWHILYVKQSAILWVTSNDPSLSNDGCHGTRSTWTSFNVSGFHNWISFFCTQLESYLGAKRELIKDEVSLAYQVPWRIVYLKSVDLTEVVHLVLRKWNAADNRYLLYLRINELVTSGTEWHEELVPVPEMAVS